MVTCDLSEHSSHWTTEPNARSLSVVLRSEKWQGRRFRGGEPNRLTAVVHRRAELFSALHRLCPLAV